MVVRHVLAPAAAQTITATTGAINGIVTDSSKAVVPGVLVSLPRSSLFTTQTAITNEAGAYRFAAVPPGDLRTRVRARELHDSRRDGIHVGLGFTCPGRRAELRPGDVSNRVVVRGAPVVDLAAAEIATHFDSNTLATLPGARDIFAVFASTQAWR